MPQENRLTMLACAAMFLVSLSSTAFGQDKESDESARLAARLKAMQAAIGRIEMKNLTPGEANPEVSAQPLLRWNNAQSRVVDGAVFIWLAEQRPQAIGNMWIKDGAALIEVQSLSADRLSAELDGRKVWSTPQAGIEWIAIPDAPSPAATKAERLRQIKALAMEFSASAIKTPPDYEAGSVWHFRMMPRPVYEYGDGETMRGAIFAFVQGTDPEMFLLIESRTGKKRDESWHCAFGASCVWELKARHRDREIWTRMKWPRTSESIYTVIEPIPIPPEFLQAVKTTTR